MKAVIKPLALLAIALAVSPAWAINKCTQADGSVAYQEAPCASGAKASSVKVVEKASPPPKVPIAIGMTAEQAVASWGTPSKVNTTVTAGGTREQWVYGYSAGGRQYLYFENGVLRTIQR